ncbi:DUF2316 family protein [Lactobacillus mulieris]|uniref:DUF2316 family protein n=1 Tax=Lactobacillus mulieris TaxID=2508708 RepID=A0AAW5X006_9LACO|nr:DUF2316 family protein [Lactobacillus mulieris]MCZ3622904.1 DUF2316 family protein [Lactobacillus mulieris]MCZ3624586.1 DUF2316 family protein [Lactobacillus mulieris]MCZ3636908.1 DUF2316 family protein [Lactobacillus mulieris]MCZ3690803.1 DUF2316 family protein [Lactobacillus mulieris]MCZ3696761.1 DUF2316 family protein [Lactobacillus mulieris]
MLTAEERKNTKYELNENFRRLNYSKERVCKDTQLTLQELDAVLDMSNPNPAYVWKVRDYLEDMLKKAGQEVYPWSKMANHSANHWFNYDTPWR